MLCLNRDGAHRPYLNKSSREKYIEKSENSTAAVIQYIRIFSKENFGELA